ncbi:gas vesicle protein GvpG [Micromonospora musae]|uniref:gas vesicle protein GvpG n=1 Tax=Micromonospora musae TaxID=1894970 RepID=UPI0033E480D1
MDILLSLLTLPYAPVRGLTAVLKVIAREAESQLYSPVNIRRELEELDAAAAAGEISPQERDERQQQVLARLTGQPARPASSPAGGGSAPDRRSDAGGTPVVRRGGPARRRGDTAGPRGGRARPAAEPARRAEAERRRDGGGGVRDGADPRRRRPNTPA